MSKRRDEQKPQQRTPLFAYVAAIIAIFVVSSAYRPILEIWGQLSNQPPSVDKTINLLASGDDAEQKEGLTAATRLRPASDAVLSAVAKLAFTSTDIALRQQSAAVLNSLARQQALPLGLLRDLPAWSPVMDRTLVTNYATLIGQAAERQQVPPNALAFLDALVAQDDRETVKAGIQAFGMVGFYHGLGESHVNMLTTLAIKRNHLESRLHAAEVAWALKLVGSKQSLPPPTIDMLRDLLRNSRDGLARQNAVRAVATQLESNPPLVDEIEAAIGDSDSRVSGAARSVLRELEKQRPVDLDEALQIAADEREPGTRRLRALQRSLQLAPADERVRAMMHRMAQSPDPDLRSGSISMATALPDNDTEVLFKIALDDSDAGVRAAVAMPVVSWMVSRDDETVMAESIKRLLSDPAPAVQQKTLAAIRRQGIDGDWLHAALREMQPADARIAHQRANLLESLVRAHKTTLERFIDAVFETKNYGLYAFVAVAAFAILVCLLLLTYFTARGFAQLAMRQWRDFVATMAVVVTWIGISVALGYAFMFGAIVAGGHNSPPPLSQQLYVVAVLLLLVGAYTLLGFWMRRLVRG